MRVECKIERKVNWSGHSDEKLNEKYGRKLIVKWSGKRRVKSSSKLSRLNSNPKSFVKSSEILITLPSLLSYILLRKYRAFPKKFVIFKTNKAA